VPCSGVVHIDPVADICGDHGEEGGEFCSVLGVGDAAHEVEVGVDGFGELFPVEVDVLGAAEKFQQFGEVGEGEAFGA